MTFQNQKKNFLKKKDKSKKSSIDAKIKNLVKKINSLENYYTTSSCSGRIMLISISKSQKKNETKWLFVSHKKIKYSQIEQIIGKITKNDNDVWLRAEPVILHIVSNNITNANNLLLIARDSGLKRSGMISINKNKTTMELISTERLEALIAKKGKVIINKEYLKILITEANAKLEKTWRKIDRFYNRLKTYYKK